MASLWQEAYDEASQCTYYYNIKTGETSWTLPADPDEEADADEDLSYMAFAVVRLQAHFRGHRDRRRVTRLLRARYQTTEDPETKQTLYTDRRSGLSSWTPPALFARLGIGEIGHDDDDDDDFDLDEFQQDVGSEGAEDGVAPDGEGGGSGEDDEDGEEDDATVKKKKRKFPRSAAQARVDAAEDAEESPTELDMSRLNAWKLSTRIWNLATLRKLSLAHNQLARIPSGIQDLVHLEHLDISHNHLTRLPSCLQTTSTLQYLDASHNHISAFSPRLWKLRALVELHLGGNALQELPFVEGDLKLLRDTREWQVGIGLLSELRVLDLSHNKLTVVPKSIEKCTSLERLDLTHNRLKVLGDELCEIEALRELRVGNNSISELPEAIGSLANLTTLVVDTNRLTALPESIGNLQSLVEIDLRRNQIHHLAEEFGALGQLQRIYLDGNASLATMAMCLRFLPSVDVFSASECGLVAFDSVDFLCKAAVTRLRLSGNGLLDFPVNLERSAMKKTLTELILAGNSLHVFPIEIVSAPCASLVTLDLSHNRLRTIPSDISKLRSLRSLVLSHNLLGPALPEAVAWLPQLLELRCDHNKLTSLPLAIGILKKLQHVDVGFNEIELLPTSFVDLIDSLRSLHVNDNRLPSPPAVVALLAPSCFVDMSNNPFCVGESINAQTQIRPQQLYAAAVKCFHEHEYETVEELLTHSLAFLDGSAGIGEWQLRKEQLPAHTYLRGLCRYMMVKHDREIVRETSQVIEECEQQLEGHQLMRLRATRHEQKTSMIGSVAVGRHKSNSNQLPEETVEGPEVDRDTVQDDKRNKRNDDSIASNQQDMDPTRERLEAAQRLRVEARNRATIATEGGLNDLDRAIRLGIVELPSAYLIQGFLYMEKLEFALAIGSFSRALDQIVSDKSQAPPRTSFPIFMARAEAYRLLGQLPAALNDVHRIIDSHTVDTPTHVIEKGEALAHEWDIQQSQYFVDHDSLFRGFDVEMSSGLARRPEVHDAHAVLNAKQRQEIKNRTPTQRFNDSVEALIREIHQSQEAARQAMQTTFDQKALVLKRARDFKREIRENLAMEMEEHTQRLVEAELARLAELKRQEMDREFNERMFMKYEDEYMKWLVSEEQRLEAERLKREEDARRKAEAKAQYEMRLARRGGRRQQLASRGAPARKTSVVASPSTGTRSPSPGKGSR